MEKISNREFFERQLRSEIYRKHAERCVRLKDSLRHFEVVPRIENDQDKFACYAILAFSAEKDFKKRFWATKLLLEQTRITFFDLKIMLAFATAPKQKQQIAHLFMNHDEFHGEETSLFWAIFSTT